MGNKQKNLILILIVIITLIAAVVGATYAYFSAVILGNQNASNIITNAGTLSLLYTDGNEINVNNIVPGWSTTKTFNVTNTGTVAVNYNIVWKELLNEIHNNDLVYSVIGTTTNLEETYIPLNISEIITNIAINPGETHEYTMTIKFINRDIEQNINQGKAFAGKIEISTEALEKPSKLILSESTSEPWSQTLASHSFLGSPIQRQQIEIIEFVNHKNIPVTAIESWDITSDQDGSAIAWYEPIGTNGRYKVTLGANGKIVANEDSKHLFKEMLNLKTINFNNNFDIRNVTNMDWMFARTGKNTPEFTLDLGSNFNTNNVETMKYMFYETASNSSEINFDLGTYFDTTNVTNMYNMFAHIGQNATSFNLDLKDKFDTSNVTDMAGMFYWTGYNNNTFTLNLGEKFDTSKVTDMQSMFQSMAQKSTTFTLDLGDRFDTSQVTNMISMFNRVGYSNPNFNLDLGIKFDVSNVTQISFMFQYAGYLNPNFTIYTPNSTVATYILNNRGASNLKSGANVIDCAETEVC